MNACTIIARNYLAQARVLAESHARQHPESRFFALVVDAEEGEPALSNEPFEVVTPAELGLGEELHRMAAMYDVLELSTALKPWLLKKLVTENPGPLAYFDPDIEIFARLDEIARQATEHGIVLTPHVTKPMPRDGLVPAEETILAAGIYNLGFIAVSDAAGEFLDWWAQHLARDCVLAPEAGNAFVDQRWIDFAPALFDPHVLRDETCNVAHWNLTSRTLERVGEQYLVNGRPLTFFHFSGFDPLVPHLLSKHQGAVPRILFSEAPDVERLYGEYAEKLLAHKYVEERQQRYRLDALPTGLQLDRRMRRLYRASLLESERNGAPEPPNPFSEPEHFLDWLRAPADPRGQAARVSRYLRTVWEERPDLQQAFPDLRWLHGDRFVAWAANGGVAEPEIPFELLPDPSSANGASPNTAEPPRPAVKGVNIAGYLRAELGIGEAARHITAAIKRAGIPYVTVAYDETSNRQEHPFEDAVEGQPVYDVNLLCVNADRLPAFTYDTGPEFFAGRHSIGVWWWEVAEFPQWMRGAFDIVDEVWVGSKHIADALAGATTKPVLVFPLPVELPEPPPFGREELSLPSDRFVFLFAFDFFSVLERKNPLGLIDAFKRAFEPGEGPLLLIKSINGNRCLAQLERLRAEIADRPDIELRDQYVSAAEMRGLMGSCDAYVSLHRSEGFGLTLAEAMAYGKPVIGTGYSGNLAFMNGQNSFLVHHGMTEIPPGCEPYPAGGEWAEPDLDEAAATMRYVFEHPDEANAVGERGRRHMREHHSLDRTAAFVTRRLDEIRALPGGGAPTPASGASAEATQDAMRFLLEGPSLGLRAPSRFGKAGVFVRRLVYRLLRPYMVRQREFELALVRALAEVEEIARDEARRAVDTGQAATRKAHEALGRATRLDRELQAKSSDQRAALSALSPRIDEAESHLQRVEARLDEVASSGETVGPRIDEAETHLQRIGSHLQRIESQLAEVAAAGQTLEARLYAPPYTADATLLTTTDEEGRPAIGYRDGAGEQPLYLGFEDIFRGPEDFIRDRQRRYVELLRDHAPVLDVGCGRGELLGLLRDAGVVASGIDVDEGMVERARQTGANVEQADAIGYLEATPAGSLGAIVALQVIEHLPYRELLRFLELARERLVPGGVLVVETVNPHALEALKSFWVDLTHQAPIYPEVAVALCRLLGFDSAIVRFPNGSGELERDRREQGEYAVVATKAV